MFEYTWDTSNSPLPSAHCNNTIFLCFVKSLNERAIAKLIQRPSCLMFLMKLLSSSRTTLYHPSNIYTGNAF